METDQIGLVFLCSFDVDGFVFQTKHITHCLSDQQSPTLRKSESGNNDEKIKFNWIEMRIKNQQLALREVKTNEQEQASHPRQKQNVEYDFFPPPECLKAQESTPVCNSI
jgi:hypothetical protein